MPLQAAKAEAAPLMVSSSRFFEAGYEIPSKLVMNLLMKAEL